MALPRYDLYGDPTIWFDNIKQAEHGQWYRAKDVDPILIQFIALGGTIPDALYPEGEALGVGRVDGNYAWAAQSGGGKLPDYEPPTIDDADWVPGDGAGSGDIGDGQAGVLPEGGYPVRGEEGR